MTKFERDLLAVIATGHCYMADMRKELLRRGRSVVHESRISVARGELIKQGFVTVSMAGRTELTRSKPFVRDDLDGGGG